MTIDRRGQSIIQQDGSGGPRAAPKYEQLWGLIISGATTLKRAPGLSSGPGGRRRGPLCLPVEVIPSGDWNTSRRMQSIIWVSPSPSLGPNQIRRRAGCLRPARLESALPSLYPSERVPREPSIEASNSFMAADDGAD